jgi:hypothetical protein
VLLKVAVDKCDTIRLRNLTNQTRANHLGRATGAKWGQPEGRSRSEVGEIATRVAVDYLVQQQASLPASSYHLSTVFYRRFQDTYTVNKAAGSLFSLRSASRGQGLAGAKSGWRGSRASVV